MGCDHDHAVPHLDGVAAAGGNGLAAPGDAADQQAVLQVQILQWDAAEIGAGRDPELHRFDLIADDLAQRLHAGISVGILHGPDVAHHVVRTDIPGIEHGIQRQAGHQRLIGAAVDLGNDLGAGRPPGKQGNDDVFFVNARQRRNGIHVLDAFLFCCYTGLRYSDFCQLTPENFIRVNGKRWLYFKSVKTGVEIRLPLYLLFESRALGILDRYPDIGSFAALPCNSEVNKQLRKLAGLCGIKKRITYHVSRHTCATLLVHQGVAITTVQKLLGHTSVKTTQIYSEVLSSTIVRDLKNLQRKRKKVKMFPDKGLRTSDFIDNR